MPSPSDELCAIPHDSVVQTQIREVVGRTGGGPDRSVIVIGEKGEREGPFEVLEHVGDQAYIFEGHLKFFFFRRK
jgi:hypothetical protein